VLNKTLPGTDGACEFRMGAQLAQEARIIDPKLQGIAALRIRGFLEKGKLVAYNLQSIQLDDAIFGVDEASRTVFGKDLSKLSLSELAELSVGLPPNNFFTELRNCNNTTLISQARNAMLSRLEQNALAPADRVRQAKNQSVGCGKGE